MKRRNLFGGIDDLLFTFNEIDARDFLKTESSGHEVNYVKDGAYLIFEVPGFNKTNLTVELVNDKLVIDGKRTYTANGQEKEKRISQKYMIGQGYDPSTIEATIEDGLLTIFVKNLKEAQKRKIKIL